MVISNFIFKIKFANHSSQQPNLTSSQIGAINTRPVTPEIFLSSLVYHSTYYSSYFTFKTARGAVQLHIFYMCTYLLTDFVDDGVSERKWLSCVFIKKS